jgi:hypothetical protein
MAVCSLSLKLIVREVITMDPYDFFRIKIIWLGSLDDGDATHTLTLTLTLPQLLVQLSAFHQLMKLHKQSGIIKLIQPMYQSVLNLMGRPANTTMLTGSVMDEHAMLTDPANAKNNSFLVIVRWMKMALFSYFGHSEDVIKESAAIWKDKEGQESLN